MRIDAWLPSYDVIDTVHRQIDAPPKEVYRALRELDLRRILWVRGLFALRTLPSRLWKRRREPAKAPSSAVGLDEIVRPGSGFVLLEEKPGEEFVVGAVGQFWKLNIPFEHVPPEGFRAFRRPGIARLAWNMRVEPRGHGTHAFSQVRIAFPDDATRRKFGTYWVFIGPFSHAIRWGALESVARALEPRRHVRVERSPVT